MAPAASGGAAIAQGLAAFESSADCAVGAGARARTPALPDLSISAVTIGEIQAGIELTREQDEPKAAELEQWLGLVAASFNALPMDAAAFRTWARLMHRASDTLYEDAMIAATAKVHQLTVVTRNVTDFKRFGVALLNPFVAARK